MKDSKALEIAKKENKAAERRLRVATKKLKDIEEKKYNSRKVHFEILSRSKGLPLEWGEAGHKAEILLEGTDDLERKYFLKLPSTVLDEYHKEHTILLNKVREQLDIRDKIEKEAKRGRGAVR